jgi:hypothetical protein
MASKFASLNELPNLSIHTYKQGDRAGTRRKSACRQDEVGERLSQCESPSDLADFAALTGITNEEIAARAESATNFGQFRMTLGNRIRNIVNILEKAQAEGKAMTKYQAAAHGAGKQYAAEKDLPKKAPKPAAKPAAVKDPPKPAKVPAPKAKPANAKKEPAKRMVPPKTPKAPVATASA